ncbi:unnamed protein product [Symbiodinium natans]|uniref:Uncharacterized protein n=1 Tax=Symbiodinium natans TaxID=878477 RepID=A0A812JE09_9DINO|nr:unnamed protein product [Symbiodinium natans]
MGQLGQGSASSIAETSLAALPPIDVGTGRTVRQTGQGGAAEVGTDPADLGDGLVVLDVGSGNLVLDVVAAWYYTCALLNDFCTKCFGDTTDYSIIYGDEPDRSSADRGLSSPLRRA